MNQNKYAFTLIELLIVVVIMGILATVALPQYKVAVAKSRAATLLPLMKSITAAQKIYYLSKGQYAADFSQLDIEFPAGAQSILNRRITYKNYVCYSGDNNRTYSSLYCSYNGGGFAFEQFYAQNDTKCWFWGNDFGKKVCKIFCGKEPVSEYFCLF